MVLSVKTTLALAVCASAFAAFETTQTSALRMYPPHRGLAGIHHTTKYAPKVVKQPRNPKDHSCSSDSESYDSYEVGDEDSIAVELQESEEMEITASHDLDLDINGPVDADVTLNDGEVLDYDGDGDQLLDISASGKVDISASAALDSKEQLDSDFDLQNGVVDVELGEDENYRQDLEFEDNEVVDEVIYVPEGAKSIHLRVHKGNVNLDIIKGATMHVKQEQPKKTEKKEEKPKEVQKKKGEEAVATKTKEETVSYAAEAKDWIQNNSSMPTFLGGIIGAAVGIVGVAGVAIAKSLKKRASEKSVLEEDVSADAEADVEVDEDEDAVSESASDSDSDEDVEADVTALTDEDAVEEKKASVVEGSV